MFIYLPANYIHNDSHGEHAYTIATQTDTLVITSIESSGQAHVKLVDSKLRSPYRSSGKGNSLSSAPAVTEVNYEGHGKALETTAVHETLRYMMPSSCYIVRVVNATEVTTSHEGHGCEISRYSDLYVQPWQGIEILSIAVPMCLAPCGCLEIV